MDRLGSKEGESYERNVLYWFIAAKNLPSPDKFGIKLYK